MVDYTDTLTLQEAAEKARFEDFMLEAGGGIRSWDKCFSKGIVYSEDEVRMMANSSATE